MGHCYRKTGSTGTAGEQGYAERVAARCVDLLNGKNGWTVRTKLADSGSYSGNAFVAVHCDGSTNTSARGASFGKQNDSGYQFGHSVMSAYERRGWTGGFRPVNYTDALANYYGVRNAIAAGNTKAIIIECGFRTNPQDLELLEGPGGVDRVALSIGDALGIQSGEIDMATVEELYKMCELNFLRIVSALQGYDHDIYSAYQPANPNGHPVEMNVLFQWVKSLNATVSRVESALEMMSTTTTSGPTQGRTLEFVKTIKRMEETLNSVKDTVSQLSAQLEGLEIELVPDPVTMVLRNKSTDGE